MPSIFEYVRNIIYYVESYAWRAGRENNLISDFAINSIKYMGRFLYYLCVAAKALGVRRKRKDE